MILVQFNSLELSFTQIISVYDGRFSNSWLQELPDPILKLTWDNTTYVSPKTASKLSLNTGDNVELSVDYQKLISLFLYLQVMPINL